MDEEKVVREKNMAKAKVLDFWWKLNSIKALRPLIGIISSSRLFRNLFRQIGHFVDIRILHSSYEQSRDYFEQNQDRVRNIQSRLADEKSRLVYERMIRYRGTHDQKYLKDIVDKNAYFDKDLINFGDKEIFVDCGAFNGDTIRSFLKNLRESGGKFREIIAFEPDPENYKTLINSLTERVGGVLII